MAETILRSDVYGLINERLGRLNDERTAIRRKVRSHLNQTQLLSHDAYRRHRNRLAVVESQMGLLNQLRVSVSEIETRGNLEITY